MEHGVREERGSLVVSLHGEVDLENSPRAREVLLEILDRRKRVLVDLAGVDYIDSSGVASLVEAFQQARKSGTRFGLVSVSEAVMRVFGLARLDKVFEIHATIDEAIDGGG